MSEEKTVGSVIVDKAQPKYVNAAIKYYKEAAAEDGHEEGKLLGDIDFKGYTRLPFEKKIRLLNEIFAIIGKSGVAMYRCDNCQGPMSAAWDNDPCPYCGKVDENTNEGETTLVKKDELPPELANLSADDLDTDVEKILKLKEESATCLWNLGNEILSVHKSERWRLRRDSEGGQFHRSFKAWVREEIGFSAVYAYRLMDTAAHFPRELVTKHGPTKLALALKAPTDNDRDILIEKIKEDATVDDLKHYLKQLKAEAAGEPSTIGDAAAASADPPKPPEKRITVAVAKGRYTVPLFAKKTLKDDEPTRATTMKELPIGTIEIENGVICEVRVTTTTNGLSAFLHFKRQKK